MIRFRNEIFDDYFIDSNGIIKDKNGEIQQLSLYKSGRLHFKRMEVHKIQMHTNYGYDKDKDIHHKDGNKTNNSLDNLIYLTKKEHTSIHQKGNKNFLGKKHSEEYKQHMREISLGDKNPMYGKTSWIKGKKMSEEYRKKLSDARKGKIWVNNGSINKYVYPDQIPEGFIKGFVKGRLKKRPNK